MGISRTQHERFRKLYLEVVLRLKKGAISIGRYQADQIATLPSIPLAMYC